LSLIQVEWVVERVQVELEEERVEVVTQSHNQR
jgi:hypothetical protein